MFLKRPDRGARRIPRYDQRRRGAQKNWNRSGIGLPGGSTDSRSPESCDTVGLVSESRDRLRPESEVELCLVLPGIRPFENTLRPT